MKRTGLVALALLLVTPCAALAHRVDEYLQATRVMMSRDRITLDVDLTPGSEIAAALLPLLDANGDGTVSPVEAQAYAERMVREVIVQLDGRSVPLTLARVEVPTTGEMREGTGAIQVRAVGSIGRVAVGRRRLDVTNQHQPVPSVYSINALVPDDRRLTVAGQTRDPRQRTVRIDYDVAPGWPLQLAWLAAGVLLLSTIRGAAAKRTARAPRGEAASRASLHYCGDSPATRR